MYPFPTCSLTVTGLTHARAMIMLLLCRSAWFALMPLPDDEYEVTFKPENESFMLNAMARLHKNKKLDGNHSMEITEQPEG